MASRRKRDSYVKFRASEPEIHLWNEHAAEQGLDLSDYIRIRLNRREGISSETQLLIKLDDKMQQQIDLLREWLRNQGIEVGP